MQYPEQFITDGKKSIALHNQGKKTIKDRDIGEMTKDHSTHQSPF